MRAARLDRDGTKVTRFEPPGDMTRESAMRTPFDSDESSWWATHGASSSKLPVAPALELEPQFEPTEYVSVEEVPGTVHASPDDPHADPYAPPTPEEQARLDLIAAQERETVRDVSLVRTAAALAAEQQASV